MSRVCKLAAASILLDAGGHDQEKIISRCVDSIIKAGKDAADLIVLPETIADIEGSCINNADVDGSPVNRFCVAAANAKVNVVAGFKEIYKNHKSNMAVVINREGAIVGIYIKVHLAPSESKDIIAGDSYPVFNLDFGRVGVTICMDLHFPEEWRILALEGADVIAHPNYWRDYTGEFCESLVTARAIDNQVYVVTSHYVQMPFLTGLCMGNSRIVDPYGRTRAGTSHTPGVAIAEVDLDEAYEYWVTGDLKKEYPTLKESFFADRKPETYGILTRADNEKKWKIKNPKLFRP